MINLSRMEVSNVKLEISKLVDPSQPVRPGISNITLLNINEWTGKKKSAEKRVQVCFFDKILEMELQNQKKPRVKVSLNDPLS